MLDEEGKTIKEGGYKSDTKLFMASSKKIFIALAILEKIYNKKEVSLSTIVSVQDSDFTPGRPDNPLDRHFFNSEEITESKTVDSLLTDMLTKSDNTATDVLIKVAGGVDAVNDFIASLGIKDHKLSMTSKKLISDYFKIPVEKSHENIQKAKTTFGIAYTMQDTEETMLTSQEDCWFTESVVRIIEATNY